MADNQSVLEQLQALLKQKKSKQWYADKLNITIEEVDELLKEAKITPESLNDRSFTEESNGKATLTFSSPDEIRTLEELIQKCKIDTEIWNIDKYVQNYWGNASSPKWQVKAFLSRKKAEEEFQDKFIEFISTYKSKYIHERFAPVDLPNACIIVNKQDEHLNKFDVDGDNDIFGRFSNTYRQVEISLNKIRLSNNIDQVIYILGGDEFNSEWTGFTTKGTPQPNIHMYEESFQLICDYEISMITNLLRFSNKIHVKYVQGNHDEYVGWHLVQFLQAYFKNESRVEFDTSMECTKVIRYSNTGMMFNHGDAIKPAKLGVMFPHLMKYDWSICDHFYIFTGDKHHEKSEDLGGIIFYQIPALSKANSKWDKKNGHILSKAELTIFVIEENIGRTDILKRPL